MEVIPPLSAALILFLMTRLNMEREKRATGSRSKADPVSNPAGLKRIDPNRAFEHKLAGPSALAENGPPTRAIVRRGRCLHVPVPGGRQVVIGSRPYEVDGVVVHRDITTSETKIFNQGEEVELPLSEVVRLTELGFLEPIEPKAKPRPPVQTSIPNDPRVRAGR